MAGAIAQSKAAFSTAAVTSIAVSFTAQTASNAIWAVGHDGSGINKAMTCADTANGSYGTQLDSVNDSLNGNTIRHWVKANIASGSNTVTNTLPGSDVFSGIYAVEASGVTTTPTDGHSGNTQPSLGTGTNNITSGAATNTATAFMLGLTIQDSSGSAGHATVGTGFTVDPNFTTGFWNLGTANGGIAEFKASVAAASNAALFSNGLTAQTFNTVMVMLDEGGGGGVTVGLTGQSSTFSAGSMSAGNSVALGGQAVTFAAGAVVPGLSLALLGTQGTFTSGFLVPNSTLSLLGQSATFSSGTITASGGGSVTVSLTGQASAFTAGTLTPASSLGLLGSAGTFTAGNVSPSLTKGLTGQAAAFSTGSLTYALSVPLNGQAAIFTPGNVQAPGNVTVALTGLRATFTAGALTAVIPGGIPVPNLIGLPWIEASHMLISVNLTQTQDPIQVQIKYAAPGIVIEQTPAAGTQVSPLTNILLTVSKDHLLSATFDVIPWYV